MEHKITKFMREARRAGYNPRANSIKLSSYGNLLSLNLYEISFDDYAIEVKSRTKDETEMRMVIERLLFELEM